MVDYTALVPVNIIAGFLGSGKTTLLQRLLATPQLPATAVLINEFGEVGLDHQLVQHVSESTLLLDNGCLCCAIRGDLQTAIRSLWSERERGEIPVFTRMVIEASGLADPAPIAYTILAEPVIQYHFRLGTIVTVVDGVNGMSQLAAFAESLKQIAVADRLLISKTDLCSPGHIALLQQRLQSVNTAAPVCTAEDENVSVQTLLLDDIYAPEARQREVSRWLAASEDPTEHSHTEEVVSFCLLFREPLDWTAFGIWMTMLLHCHGEAVLRIKGLLNVAGLETPVLINGVQHMIHPPTHLEAWPDSDHRSRIVFIVRNLARERIEASLHAFNGLVN